MFSYLAASQTSVNSVQLAVRITDRSPSVQSHELLTDTFVHADERISNEKTESQIATNSQIYFASRSECILNKSI